MTTVFKITYEKPHIKEKITEIYLNDFEKVSDVFDKLLDAGISELRVDRAVTSMTIQNDKITLEELTLHPERFLLSPWKEIGAIDYDQLPCTRWFCYLDNNL